MSGRGRTLTQLARPGRTIRPGQRIWNLSRNPRVCLGFQPPGGQALVHGEEGSLRIREEKALEFINFFSRFTKENGKYIFFFSTKPCLGLPRSARAYNPLEGRLGLGPQKIFKVPARVCVTCPGSAWGSDRLGAKLWSMVGAWDLVLIFLSKSQLVCVEPVQKCQGLPGVPTP